MRILRPFGRLTTAFAISTFDIQVFDAGMRLAIVQRLRADMDKYVNLHTLIVRAVELGRIDVFEYLVRKKFPPPSVDGKLPDAVAAWNNYLRTLRTDHVFDLCIKRAISAGSVSFIIILRKLTSYGEGYHDVINAAIEGRANIVHVLLKWHHISCEACAALQYCQIENTLWMVAVDHRKLRVLKVLGVWGYLGDSNEMIERLLENVFDKRLTSSDVINIRKIANFIQTAKGSITRFQFVMRFGDIQLIHILRSSIVANTENAVDYTAIYGRLTIMRTILNWCDENQRRKLICGIVKMSPNLFVENQRKRVLQMIHKKFPNIIV